MQLLEEGTAATAQTRQGHLVTATPRLVRLALRRERILLPVWVGVIILLLAASAASIVALYQTEAERLSYATVAAANAVARAFDGPLAGTSLGAITMAETFGILAVLVGVMNVLSVVRLTRQEEETGRAELVRSTPVGRHASLVAALAVAFLANLVVAAATALTLLAFDLPAKGSVAAGLSLAGVGICFAALGALGSQLASGQRAARGLGVAMVGVAFLLRAIGDAAGRVAPSGVEVVSAWPSWLSPIGWGQQLRAYGDERWWVLLLFGSFALIVSTGSVLLSARRDFGAGLLADRPGPPAASTWLSSPLGLALFLQRNVWIAYAAGLSVFAVAFGSIGDEAEELVETSEELAALFEALGDGVLTDLFFAFFLGILAIAATAFTVQSLLRLRAEEADGRAEPLLATPVSRLHWLLSHATWATVGTGLILLLAGVMSGVGYSIATGDPSRIPELLVAALVHLPAALALGGSVAALIGLAPRVAVPFGWALLVGSFVMGQLGALLGLPQWLLNLSPFTHIPAMPAEELVLTPILVLLGAAAALGTIGALALRARDLTGPS
jgi:ABC-2 type transport system permease protein